MHLKVCHITHILCFVLGCSFTLLLTSYDLKKEGFENVFEKEEFQLIVIILSSPENVIKRYAIRQTWLRDLNQRSSYMFVIGSLGFTAEQRKTILSEQSEHNDILLLPLHEGYQSLTKKLLATLVHVYQTYKFDFLLKTDDDTFVNLRMLNEAMVSVDKQKPVYWGYFNGRASVFKKGKWKEDQWFLCDRYLPYALGGGYILTYPAVELIVDKAQVLSTYNSEDVSLGVWLSPYNISRIHDIRFDSGHVSRGCSNSHMVTHKQTPEHIRALYASLSHSGVSCSVETQYSSPYEYDWKVPPSKCCLKSVL
ncbi:unnamed protein product [Nezara viridula]|uniref:Hexosyltransferase n=1 Tax=Nezara viridula TaxID=85310 RepID=A0A9P0EFI2_NEZVI|nr:unnamed protein product [Nezara viridula]